MPMRSKVFNTSTVLFLFAALAFLYYFLFVPPFLPTQGSSWDSLLYLAPGQRMYQGEIIYRDVFEFVTPGTALVNFLMFKLFGLRLWIPDLLAVLLGAGLAFLGVVISRKIMRPGLALLPSAVFLVSARGFLCDATHHWYSVLAAIAAVAVLLEKRTPGRIAAAGLLCGLSASFTQTRGLAVAAGFAVFLWWETRQRREGWRGLLRNEMWLLAGCFSAFLALNAYFIWEAGPARYFWCTVVYVMKYYPKLASANTFQVISAEFPVYISLRTFLHPFAQWLFLSAFIPLVYILFFARYWRESPSEACGVLGAPDARGDCWLLHVAKHRSSAGLCPDDGQYAAANDPAGLASRFPNQACSRLCRRRDHCNLAHRCLVSSDARAISGWHPHNCRGESCIHGDRRVQGRSLDRATHATV